MTDINNSVVDSGNNGVVNVAPVPVEGVEWLTNDIMLCYLLAGDIVGFDARVGLDEREFICSITDDLVEYLKTSAERIGEMPVNADDRLFDSMSFLNELVKYIESTIDVLSLKEIKSYFNGIFKNCLAEQYQILTCESIVGRAGMLESRMRAKPARAKRAASHKKQRGS